MLHCRHGVFSNHIPTYSYRKQQQHSEDDDRIWLPKISSLTTLLRHIDYPERPFRFCFYFDVGMLTHQVHPAPLSKPIKSPIGTIRGFKAARSNAKNTHRITFLTLGTLGPTDGRRPPLRQEEGIVAALLL